MTERLVSEMDKIKTNLEKKGYKVSVFDTAQQAADYMSGVVTGTTVGIGGCMSAVEMGLYEKLSAENTVYWHWKATAEMPSSKMIEMARKADVYICSVNGISEKGEIINIDGNGNRIAETMYGHRKVYLIVGENKIAPDFEKALWRARNIAAPLNAKRLGTATPCALKGDKCYDCRSPARICRGVSIFWEKPNGCDYEIVLVKEKLGY